MWLLKSLLSVIFIVTALADDPIVNTRNGKVKGTIGNTLRRNVQYYAFEGIPFAAPPVGNLRFQPPQPVKNWSEILDAKSSDKACISSTKSAGETEDCLYLSITTPSINALSMLPVLIHIHGGGFTHGHQIATSQRQFHIERNVVVASINYRLGPFGFLSTGDGVVPGNMGLKDQHQAIKWIHDNVLVFGGDPNKITLIGQSAGGASVTYQIIYPQNKGLFRAGIANSGSTLSYWAYQRHSVDSAYGMASMIDSKITKKTSTAELLNFLQSVPTSSIVNTYSKYNVWAPVMEVPHDGAFFTKSMYELVQNGEVLRVPLLIGINSLESAKSYADQNTFKRTVSNYDKEPSKLINEDMYISDKNAIHQAATEIKKIYTNNSWEQSPAAALKFMSDDHFARAPIKYAELHSAYSDVYFYYFSYHGILGGNNISVPGFGYGVAHAEDLSYQWANYHKNIVPADLLTVDRFVTFQTNFAKTLNPTPAKDELFENIIWPKVSKNNFLYVDINANLTVQKNPREDAYEKWVNIWEAYARKPFISF